MKGVIKIRRSPNEGAYSINNDDDVRYYFLILFSKGVTMQSNHLQFALCLHMYIFHKSFLCLFCCSAFLTLLEVIKLTFIVYFIIRTNLRIFQILSNKSFNLYLFKRVTFDAM